MRKIFNHESTILIQETLDTFGYHPDRYGPASAKFVIARCRFCGTSMKIRKGFFNKSGSACHKECKIQEMKKQVSPFSDPKVIAKSKRTNLERYGTPYAAKNKQIAAKISQAKQNPVNKPIKEIKEFLSSHGFTFSLKDNILYVRGTKLAIRYVDNLSACELNNPHAQRSQIKAYRSCNNRGIRLFHIFQHQWENYRSQILNFLKSILGVNTVKVGARKCKVAVTIDHRESIDFMNQNHIQGYGFGTIRFFDLIYEDEIVASMTASHHHRQNSDSQDIVLNRLCFRDGYNVQGGASKLFKCFKQWARNSGYTRIVSWSDNAWTRGGVYQVLGFRLDREYGADYFYWSVKKSYYVGKQSQQKKKTGCPVGMTEREWSQKRDLYRVWDAGKKRWVFNL